MKLCISLATEGLSDHFTNVFLDCFENQCLNDMIESNIAWITGGKEEEVHFSFPSDHIFRYFLLH